MEKKIGKKIRLSFKKGLRRKLLKLNLKKYIDVKDLSFISILFLFIVILTVVYPGLFAIPKIILKCFAIDNWVYTGFTWNLPGHLKLFPETYPGTRLPYIFPGYLLVMLLGPVIGGYILKASFFLIAALSLFYYSKLFQSFSISVLTVVFAICVPYVLLLSSWDYPCFAGLTYAALCLCLIEYGIKPEGNHICCFLAGATAVFLLFTNLILAAFFFPGFTAYVLCRNGRNVFKAWNCILCCIIGGLLATVLLCISNFCMGGLFLFFTPSLDAAMSIAQNVSRPPWKFNQVLLILPYLGFVLAASTLFFEMKHRSYNSIRLSYSVFILVSYIMLGYEYIKYRIYPAEIYVNYYILFSVISIFIFLFNTPAPEKAKRENWIHGLFIGFSLFIFFISVNFWDISFLNVSFFLQFATAFLLCVAARIITRPDVKLLLLAVLFIFVALNTIKPIKKENFNASEYLREYQYLYNKVYEYSKNKPPLFWWDGTISKDLRIPIKKPASSLFDEGADSENKDIKILAYTITSFFLWEYSLLSYEFPTIRNQSLKNGLLERMMDKRKLFIILPENEDINPGLDSLKENNIHPKILHEEKRSFCGSAYKFYIIEKKEDVHSDINEKQNLLKLDSATDVLRKLECNRYNISRFLSVLSKPYKEKSSEIIKYIPFSGKDHITTEFFTVPEDCNYIVVKFRYPENSGFSNLRIFIQSESYELIKEIQSEEDKTVFYSAISVKPSKDKKIRLVFSGKAMHYAILPSSIIISAAIKK